MSRWWRFNATYGQADRAQSFGAAALVTPALTDCGGPDEADAIRDRITYMELNVNQEFMNRFSAAKFIPHTDVGRFPSVAVPR